jgi:hypothetical protein
MPDSRLRRNKQKYSLILLVIVIAAGRTFAAGRAAEENVIRSVEKAELERETQLNGYSVSEHYTLRNSRFQAGAERTVSAVYKKGSGDSYQTISQSGSSTLQRTVLDRLLQAQAEMSGGETRQHTLLTSANYDMRFVGEESLDGRRCIVLELIPRTKSIYLLKGRAWFDAEDRGILRIEGRPTASPSLWAGHPMIVRDYQKINGFSVAKKSHAVSDSFLLGKTELTIEYSDYMIVR